MNEILILFVLLLLSGIFSGSETALIALSMARVEALVKEGRPGAPALYALKHDPSRMLITILIGNNLVNIAAASLATVVATKWFGQLGPGLAVGVLTILILIFGEITPKSLATRHAERISLFIAPVMLGLMRLLYPLVWLFGHFTTWVHQLTSLESDPIVTESELLSLMHHGEMEGTIELKERELIEKVFAFNDLSVRDVMTPRNQIFSVDGKSKISDVIREVIRHNYSRIPVYNNHPDEIRKVLYLRDLLKAAAENTVNVHVRDIAHDALFVPGNQFIDELFSLMRCEKRHMAVVVDEFGAVQGVATLEDLLEELFGEIYDESDKAPSDPRSASSDELVVDGAAELRVVEKFFQIDLPGKPTDSVSLWILNVTEEIPGENQDLVIDGLEVKIIKASPRRIHKVRIRHRQVSSPSSDDDPGSQT
ncbi:MAG: hemolysin family protein [Pseudomonadota bacterium]|nr:hemolysin family protein [Pseudomonadota bacterium]